MHDVAYIHIDGEKDEVTIECSCGWISQPQPTESEAMVEFNTHAEDDS